MATAMQNPGKKESEKPDEPFDKAKEAGAHAVEKAKEAAESVGTMASQTIAGVGKKADDLTSSFGGEIKKFGTDLGDRSPHEGFAGHASQAVAETIRDGGHYLEDAKLSGIADDLSKLIRSHPLPAVAIGIGIGLFLGRSMRS